MTYWQRMTGFARAHPRATRFMDLHHHGTYLDAESLAARPVSIATQPSVFIAEAGRLGRHPRSRSDAGGGADVGRSRAGLIKFAAQGAFKFDVDVADEMEEALWRAIAND